jgi:simple sugar transport system ATP-binding protein
MQPGHELLRVDGVSKAFPGILANDAVTFDLRAGEIHALVGENGAGKTTLMGLLFGIHRPDRGRILVDGSEVALDSPRAAILHGIGFVQQHNSLIPTLTVLDNIVLSQRYGGTRPPARAAIAARVRGLAERYALAVDLHAVVERLSVGEQQRVELIKALIGDPRILILDEPAALLSAEEVARLWRILRDLAANGVGIILIGHKLDEVLAVADRVTVLRHGRNVATVAAADATASSLGGLMVGDLREGVRASSPRPAAGAPALDVADLWVTGERGNNVIRSVSFSVRSGEILGVAGLEGGGPGEMLEALAGIRRIERGAIRLRGTDISAMPVRWRQAHGIAYIPPDRHRDGLVGPMDLADNLALSEAVAPKVSRRGILRPKAMEREAAGMIARFDIRAAGPKVAAETLSGGNQQKLILARELAGAPDVILCCHPTRGLDFAATASVHDELRRAADRGAAVLLVSTDLGELFDLAERLIVIQGGRIAGEAMTAGVSAEAIGLMMGGGVAA